jgi:hypothetical protein
MMLYVSKHSQIHDAVCEDSLGLQSKSWLSCCESWWLWFCWCLILWSFKYTTRTLFISDWSIQLSLGDFIPQYIFMSSAKRRQFEYLTALHKSFVTTLKRSDPRTDPCGTTDNTSYSRWKKPTNAQECCKQFIVLIKSPTCFGIQMPSSGGNLFLFLSYSSFSL